MQKKYAFSLAYIVFSVILISYNDYIGVANHHHKIDQLPRPAYKGRDTSAYYLSGGMMHNWGSKRFHPLCSI